MEIYRQKLASIKGHTSPLDFNDESKNTALFRAYIEVKSLSATPRVFGLCCQWHLVGILLKTEEIYDASQGLWHFQNPYLGPGHVLGVSDASASRHLMQNSEFRLYVAGLVHHSADRMLPSALLEVRLTSFMPSFYPASTMV